LAVARGAQARRAVTQRCPGRWSRDDTAGGLGAGPNAGAAISTVAASVHWRGARMIRMQEKRSAGVNPALSELCHYVESNDGYEPQAANNIATSIACLIRRPRDARAS
jgi:hypothetical protein